MALSMTGFGAGEVLVGTRVLQVEIRAVNHRFFNFTARLPGDLQTHEVTARERIRQQLERGHITLAGRWHEEVTDGAVSGDAPYRDALIRLTTLRDALGLTGDITLDQVLRNADMARPPREMERPELPWEAIAPAIDAAITACRAAREREGEALIAALRGHAAALATSRDRIAAWAPQRLQREHERLRQQLALLLDGAATPEARVAEEIALYADRVDITEELVRLAAHLAAVDEALAQAGPIGKQLGFLAQELGREINTIGSKANDAAITREVIAMKGALEHLREQVENLE